jgi:hypothetical protein
VPKSTFAVCLVRVPFLKHAPKPVYCISTNITFLEVECGVAI